MKIQKRIKLGRHEVHIWYASLVKNKNLLDYFCSLLSIDEQDRMASFKVVKAQLEFAITRGILRILLANYLGQSPYSLEFVYGLWGKPLLLTENDVHFSVSHSKDHALFALTRFHEVGVDLEFINYEYDIENMANLIFSESELLAWKQLGFQDKKRTFFIAWVCKEAILKSQGKGWLGDHRNIAFFSINATHTMNRQNETANPLYFECIPGYASALYINGPKLKPCFFSWDENSSLF